MSTPAIERPEPVASQRAKRQREGRPLEALLQSRRDQANDAARPALARHHHRRAALFEAERGKRLGFGLGERRQLDLLAGAVETVEFGGDVMRLRLVTCRQQAHAERRVADAAAGVDARPDQKTEMIGARRAVGAGDVEQRGEARASALAHRLKAARDEGAIEADERHDVGDGRERDEIEPSEEVGRDPAGKEAAVAQSAVQRDKAHVDDAGGAEMSQTREIVLTVGIDNGERVRQLLRRLMMIEDDDIEAEPLGGGDRLMADRAAIDSDDKTGAASREGRHRLAVGAVALSDAIGNVDDRLAAAGFEVFAEQRRARRAIDIVIAEDRDALARRTASISRAVASSMSASVNGSGISARRVGSR